MCISKAACSRRSLRGVTLVEIIVVLVIMAVIAGIGGASWAWRLETEAARNAKIYLKYVWQAEQNYFSWKDEYTNDWNSLEVDNPNNIDRHYTYAIPLATNRKLRVTATRKGKGFSINEDGNITSF